MQPIMITGASGTLGDAFARICDLRALAAVRLSRHDLDITDASALAARIADTRPWAVVNAAGYVRVDDAEDDREACFIANADGPAALAVACADAGLPLVSFSSDLVFDGKKRTPYLESDPVGPLSVYGESKVAAETAVLERFPGALMVRSAAFFGPWDWYNFATCIAREIRSGRRQRIAGDVTVSPTYLPDLVNTVLDLLIDGERGIWHLANVGAVTWSAFAEMICNVAGLDRGLIDTVSVTEMGYRAERPTCSALGSSRGQLLPPLSDAVERWYRDLQR